MSRRVLHIDMDAFFASVEQVLNPALEGKPLIIGGERTDMRGVVSTASYEARKYGVHSAMPIAQAVRLCPHGVYLRGNFSAYRAASARIRRILEGVSPVVQFTSIDEAYVDVTGSLKLFGGEDAIAQHIKDTIRKDTGLPSTVAITPNKLVSKIASDEAKPDGYICLEAHQIEGFMRPLAVAKLPGVGPRTQATLKSMGICTAGDILDMPERRLLAAFGPSSHGLRRMAEGQSESEVEPYSIPKSISRETTFDHDHSDWEVIERILMHLTERAMFALREQRMECKRVTLKIRYSDLSIATFAHTLPEPTAVDGYVCSALKELLPKAKQKAMRVRLAGVALSGLHFNQHQIPLFGRDEAEKWERVLGSVDEIRARHGFGLIRMANSITDVPSSLYRPGHEPGTATDWNGVEHAS